VLPQTVLTAQAQRNYWERRGVYKRMLTDLRYALRGLRRSPAFAVTAILAAALGIGAATAVFSVVDRILFRALPYAHADRMVSVGMLAPLDTNEFMFAVEYFDLQRSTATKQTPFESASAFQAGSYACDLTEQNPLRMDCLRLQANFLDTFGVAPLLGRTFTADEDHPGGPRAAMISYALWQSRFAGDPHVLGRSIPVDGAATIIVGVLPQTFEMPTLTTADVLLPLALADTERQGRALRVFARLKPGVKPPAAMAQLQPHFERAMVDVPPQFRKEISFRVRPIRDRQVGDVRLASLALFGSVIAVLLIACANIANLLLARAVVRDRELAMRTVLGASRARLARQALTESLLLGGLGGAAGCALAFALLRVFIGIAPGALPRLAEASIDLRVLLFAVAATLASSLLFGIAPALRAPRAVSIAGWHATGPARTILRSALVTTQIAVSMVLLTGAGLLLRSLWKLESVPLGMETSRVIAAHFTLGRQRYLRPEDQLAFVRDLERRITGVPGLQAAAVTDSLPPTGGMRGHPLAAIGVEGRAARPEGTGGMVGWRYVTPGYFETLGVPVIRGRAFLATDRDPGVHSVILSEGLARRLFPDSDALGQRIRRGEGPWSTVVGITRDVKNDGLAKEAWPEYYELRKSVIDFNYQQQEPPLGWRSIYVVVRTAIPPSMAAANLRTLIESLDSTLPVETQTMDARLDGITARPRFNAFLLAVFAAMGALLAATGLFGMMAFLVAQRTREIGVRMALGATPAAILRWTLRHAARWTVAGLALGVGGSLALARVLRALLFQVEPGDPRVIGGALFLLGFVALAAAAAPARRAARLQPMETLRAE
jgi:putative ABC transport system permease protein